MGTRTEEMGPLARVYLVRHGETQANREGVIQGRLDTALNARGAAQARMASEALAGVVFHRAYSSDLQRASETARVILERHEGVELVTETALRERFMGALEGKSVKDVGGLSAAGAETGPAFNKRAVDWWKARVLGTVLDTRGEEEHTNVLVTSHGGFITALVRELVGSRKARAAAGVVLGHCANASVTVVEVYGNKRGVIVQYGDQTHLDGETLESNADEINK